MKSEIPHMTRLFFRLKFEGATGRSWEKVSIRCHIFLHFLAKSVAVFLDFLPEALISFRFGIIGSISASA
jgi:hypothetical protein